MTQNKERASEFNRDRNLLLALGGVGLGTVVAEVAVIGIAGPDTDPVALGLGAGILVVSGLIVDRIHQHYQRQDIN